MSRDGRNPNRRSYRPAIETLEVLRLLDAAQSLTGLMVEQAAPSPPVETDFAPTSDETWDLALSQTSLSDLLEIPVREADPEAIEAGLGQLDRYLVRSWYRAGLAPQQHDDCTQAVYVALLQNLGRHRFDQLASEIGRVGIRDVLSRETLDGPDFFRAVDTVKKRAQRERSFQSLDQIDVPAASPSETSRADLGGGLREVIATRLTAREADLIDSTLRGETPSEIAERWGVAPKTVSNEKTRALNKLREALTADLAN